MVGRLLRTADFQRVLATPPRSRSTHFAVHHVADRPLARAPAAQAADAGELSTGDARSCPPLVDDSVPASPPATVVSAEPAVPPGQWLGLVVPKRHARRAVTRTLIKRQMRAVMAERAASLPAGVWVLRLKAGFDLREFPSAASDALRRRARAELGLLFDRAAAPRPAPSRPRG